MSLLSASGTINVMEVGDPYWDKVVALLHFDGDLTDEKGVPWQLHGSATIDSETPLFGAGSLSIPGTSGYVETTSPSLGGIASQDITIELFVKVRSMLKNAVLFDFRPLNTNGAYPQLYYVASGELRFQWGESIVIASATGVIRISDEPMHVAFVRSGGVHKLYVDGQQAGPAWAGGTSYSEISRVRVGRSAFGSSVSYPDALIDEFRITKGVARYTENFTPPTKPFPNS